MFLDRLYVACMLPGRTGTTTFLLPRTCPCYPVSVQQQLQQSYDSDSIHAGIHLIASESLPHARRSTTVPLGICSSAQSSAAWND